MKRTLRFWLVSALLSVFTLLIAAVFVQTPQRTGFVPPEFDPQAQQGTPAIPEELPHGSAALGDYQISIAAVISVKEWDAAVYFVNHVSNDVWMKLRIFNLAGEVIGESGLIKPDEFLESVRLREIPDESAVIVKIMCYEPNTYHSKGSSQITLAITKR